MTHHQHEPFRRHNVSATFKQRTEATEAVRDLESQGIPRSIIHIEEDGTGAEAEGVARAEMTDEVEGALAGPSIVSTATQTRGWLAGTAVGTMLGALTGALVGLPWALAADGPWSPMTRFLLAVGAFAVAGSTAGFVAGGSLGGRMEGMSTPGGHFDDPSMATERAVIVAVHADDEATISQAATLLQRHEPERMDHLDEEGHPTQSGRSA